MDQYVHDRMAKDAEEEGFPGMAETFRRVGGHLVAGGEALEVCLICSCAQSYFEVRRENC